MNFILNFVFYHTPIFYLIQSVWRDEAFSYFMAKPGVLQVTINTAHDFNPPLYYLLLHFWMKITGQSDEGLRILSLTAHLASVLIVYIFAEKKMSKKFASFVAVFTLLNPMLLYYAFEIRMYSFFALLTITSFYFFYFKNWTWYTIAAILGLYTHSFFPLILISFAFYFLVTHNLTRKNLWLTVRPFIFFLPWLPVLAIQFISSKNSWLFPVDLQLILSALGNLFTGYEGTPGGLWGYSALLSAIIIIFIIIGIIKKKREGLIYIIPIFLPLLAILGYSIVKRPLFVNRYMIFVTVFEILAISWGIWHVKNKILRNLSMAFWIVLITGINIVSPPYRQKTDFKSALAEINKMAGVSDFAYTKTPIAFLETAYYFKNKDRVFVYNPAGITIPYFIGVTVVFPNISKSSLPAAPSRTFMLEDDASFTVIKNQQLK